MPRVIEEEYILWQLKNNRKKNNELQFKGFKADDTPKNKQQLLLSLTIYVRQASYILLRISNDERVVYTDTETLILTLLNHLLGWYETLVQHTAIISNDERQLYNDTKILMVRLQSYSLDSYVTHVLHTSRISNDERVLYNDTETLMVRILSHLLGSYVTDDLHTARISNDDRVLYNDTETLMVRLLI